MGSGIDIVDIKRMERAAKSERFVKRVFTAEEIAYAAKRKTPSKHLAGRFAAKEACIKALDKPEGLKWTDMEVVNSVSGRPSMRLHGEAAKALGMKRIFLSIAYTKYHALAVVAIV
ncbi:MAG: holo-ACP synthase [Deltaproteobacteria bacterium]|nr:holo-ACP synthase [Deltaproteobacteria bacterium]